MTEGSGSHWYNKKLHGPLRWLGIILLWLIIFLFGLAVYRAPAYKERQLTEQVVPMIQAQRITIDDVDGKHLPPEPDPKLVDATIEGIDANQNGIRDDVELAIFKKYPNNTKLRAAELQYAAGLQTELTKVFNTDTWKAAVIQSSRGYACVSGTYPRDNLDAYMRVTGSRTNEVEALQLNTGARLDKYKSIQNYSTSFGLPNEDLCDVDIE